MSNENDEDFEDDNDSKLVKDLRKQLKELSAAKAESDRRAAEAEARDRAATVADRLKAAGAKPELAKFYTADDSSEDAVNKWISENAELFGIETPGENEPTPEERAAAARVAQVAATAASPKIGSPESFQQEMLAAKTPQELQAVYEKYGHSNG